MRAEDVLREPLELEKRIQARFRELQEVIAVAGPDYSQPRVQASDYSDRVPEMAARAIAIKDEIRELQEEFLYKFDEVGPELLQHIEDEDHRDAVNMYYRLGMTMKQTCEALHVSNVTAYKWRDKGIEALQEYLDQLQ
ncbi:MAG: DUF1492 domain-containing protein [Elusimicrobiaceae bacterium]|nr:DUF1492 domain-containing protein [Elusimicrobiaceae bacterium]